MTKEIILKPKGDETVTFSIRVDKTLVERFSDLANRSGYSRNELIGMAMQHYIDNVRFVPDEAEHGGNDEIALMNKPSEESK